MDPYCTISGSLVLLLTHGPILHHFWVSCLASDWCLVLELVPFRSRSKEQIFKWSRSEGRSKEKIFKKIRLEDQNFGCQTGLNRSYKSGEILRKASPADLNRVSRAMYIYGIERW